MLPFFVALKQKDFLNGRRRDGTGMKRGRASAVCERTGGTGNVQGMGRVYDRGVAEPHRCAGFYPEKLYTLREEMKRSWRRQHRARRH